MKPFPRKLYTFVGECRSLKAIRNDWTWKDGRLAAKPLFEALGAMGIDPGEQDFMNLYNDPPKARTGLISGAWAVTPSSDTGVK